MPNSIVMVPVPDNEPILSYAPGTPERTALKEKIQELKSQEIEIDTQWCRHAYLFSVLFKK